VQAILGGGIDELTAAHSVLGSRGLRDKGKRPATEQDVGAILAHVLPQAQQPHLPSVPADPADHEDQAMQIAQVTRQVLEIVPDVDQHFLHRLIVSLFHTQADVVLGKVENTEDRVLEAVLHSLLERSDYPRTAKIHEVRPDHSKLRELPAAGSFNAIIQSSSLTGGTDGCPVDQRNTDTNGQSSDAGPSNGAGVVVGCTTLSTVPEVAPGKVKGRADSYATEQEHDPGSRIVAQVVEIIPDVDPSYLLKLVDRQLGAVRLSEEINADGIDFHERALQAVLHVLFENCNFPRVSKKRKRTGSEDEIAAGPAKSRRIEEVDFGSKDRIHTGSKYYDEMALVRILIFPRVLIH
jgi:hypothetical protein